MLFPAGGVGTTTFVEVEFDMSEIMSQIDDADTMTIKGYWATSGSSYQIAVNGVTPTMTVSSQEQFEIPVSGNITGDLFSFQLAPATHNTALLVNHLVMEYLSHDNTLQLKIHCETQAPLEEVMDDE